MTNIKKPKLFYGWIIVLSSSLMFLFGAGVFFYGFGTFFNPIRNEFGWSSAITAGAFTLYRLEGGIAAPAVGFGVERYGPRKLMIIGILVMGSGFLMMSATSSIPSFYATFLITSLGFSAAVGIVGQTAVSNWFIKKRGQALGLTMAGAGLAGVIAPLLQYLITQYGWRATLVIIGILVWVVLLPLAGLVRAYPEDYGLLPDGVATSDDKSKDEITSEPHLLTEVHVPWRPAIRTRTFWLLAFTSGISNLATSGITVLVIPHLENVGIRPSVAALAITFITLVSVVGRLGGGWLGDHFDKRHILAIGLVLQALGALVLAKVDAIWKIIPFVLLYAPGYGCTIPIRPAIAAEAFGRASFGSIQGLLQGVMTLLSVPGPLLGGLIFDMTGSYSLGFLFFGAATLAVAPTALMIKKYD
jgi:MFS family permease